MRAAIATLCAAVMILIPCGATAERVSLGHSGQTVLIPAAGHDRGEWYQNHDGTFENGYYWDHGGCLPPYAGGFAEAFDLGGGLLEAADFWFTQIGVYQQGTSMDVYVWTGGVSAPPSGVMHMVPDVTGMEIPFWPHVGETIVEIGRGIRGEFTVGYWPDWPGQQGQWYICADENGPAGHPWTNIAAGIGYPAGWNPVSIVFEDCRALGIGVLFTRDTSGIEEFPGGGQVVESPTWGRIKAIFAR